MSPSPLLLPLPDPQKTGLGLSFLHPSFPEDAGLRSGFATTKVVGRKRGPNLNVGQPVYERFKKYLNKFFSGESPPRLVYGVYHSATSSFTSERSISSDVGVPGIAFGGGRDPDEVVGVFACASYSTTLFRQPRRQWTKVSVSSSSRMSDDPVTFGHGRTALRKEGGAGYP